MGPRALMGFWFPDLMLEPFLDMIPVSEIEERTQIGWQLVARTRDIPGWWSSSGRLSFLDQPVRKNIPDSNGANDKDE